MSCRGSYRFLAFMSLWATTLLGGAITQRLFAADRFETIEGERAEGLLTSVTAGKLVGTGISGELRWDELRTIARTVDAYEAPAKGIMETSGGGRLPFALLAYSDDRARLTLSCGLQTAPSIEEIRSIRFDTGAVQAAFQDALALPLADADRIFVKAENSLEAVRGLLTAIDDKHVTIEVDGKANPIARERVYGIVTAQSGKEKPPAALVTLDDGTRIPGTSSPPANGKLQLESFGKPLSLSWDAIASIEFHSSRLFDLAAAEPIAVEERTVLTLPAPFRRNQSVGGTPLMLGTTKYQRGLGVHSRSSLTFEIPADAETFLAVIGIDASLQGRGDCEFQVLGDGRTLYTQRVRGSDEPRSVRVACKGVKKLTLLVEPGEEFDFGDHADWCDCRVLRARP